MTKRIFKDHTCKREGCTNIAVKDRHGLYMRYCSDECNPRKQPRICEYSLCNNPQPKNKYGNYCQYCSEECKVLGYREKFKEIYADRDTSDTLEKRKATNLERYGVENVSQTDAVREKLRISTASTADIRLIKTKENNLTKYGVESTNSLQEVKDKKKGVFMERYGVDHQLKIPEIAASVSQKNLENATERFAKSAITNMERYGCVNPSSNLGVQQRRKDTCVERFGVEHHWQNEEVKQRRMDTCIKNHGVPYPQQNLEIFRKQEKGRLRHKDYILPSGKIVQLQGYEHLAIDMLLKEGYKETDFDFDAIPVISYVYKGTIRKYYPDLYIPKDNLIIEVKSTYTFDNAIYQNLEKEKASIEQGYLFRFMILDGKHKLLEYYDKS